MARPWQTIDRVPTAEGMLELRRRGDTDFLITIADRVLMNSSANRSEVVLSELACQAMANQTNPRILMGGLGLGFSLQAALANLPREARVLVAELNPVVLTWCQGPLASLTGAAVADHRVTVEIADVADVIQQAARHGDTSRFDAIILDLYEGPHAGGREEGDYLYGDAALAMAGTALQPGGVFAVWSEDPDRAFERRLAEAGFTFVRQRLGHGGRRHMVYIARQTLARPTGHKHRAQKS